MCAFVDAPGYSHCQRLFARSFARMIGRVNELRNIPGSNMEVVIFFVGSDRCSTTADGSSVGSISGSSGGGERRARKESGPISVCLWTPTKCEFAAPARASCVDGQSFFELVRFPTKKRRDDTDGPRMLPCISFIITCSFVSTLDARHWRGSWSGQEISGHRCCEPGVA